MKIHRRGDNRSSFEDFRDDKYSAKCLWLQKMAENSDLDFSQSYHNITQQFKSITNEGFVFH